MKIRIANNSIRFRLKQPDVMFFCNTGSISEQIAFGPLSEECLRFILKKYEGTVLDICFEGNAVTVFVPEPVLEQWATTELVGIDDELHTKKNKIVGVLIEKDFACLDAGEEENEGSYPNPLANCQTMQNAH